MVWGVSLVAVGTGVNASKQEAGWKQDGCTDSLGEEGKLAVVNRGRHRRGGGPLGRKYLVQKLFVLAANWLLAILTWEVLN